MPEKTLPAKIAAVRADLSRVGLEKTGYNDYNHYHYAEEWAILDALNPLLEKHKLLIIPSVEEKRSTPLERGVFTEIHMVFSLIDIETGEERAIHWYGDAVDTQDKGLYKAYTGATKYFLMKLFGLSISDDPETDKGEKYDQPKRTKGQKAASMNNHTGHTMNCPTCGSQAAYHHTDPEYGEVFVCGNKKCPKNGARFRYVNPGVGQVSK